ncbi:uncharacterized protein LOC121796800 [Salvia splendens]|uniref:uncharacterized protein LOC121796800 n=1 Tax=Salvia splendens TaxID=180675 RepID=UPI001C26327F|nr:uncharacterized protein LOC121796800 [Salvia splendens]
MADDDEKNTTETKPKTSNDHRLRVSKNVADDNGTNYSIWSRLMKVQIGSRRVLRHINGNPPPPEPGAADYTEWEETDLIVFSWILDNIETDIFIDFAHHQTAEALWKNLAVTFEGTSDPFLLFDMEEKDENVKQGEQILETYWRHLHGTWIDVDRCQEKLVTCYDKGVDQFGNTSRHAGYSSF